MAELLLSHKPPASANAMDRSHKAPLHLACENGHEAVMEVLLRSSADVNAGKKQGWQTPLHVACRKGHHSVASRLLESGASLDATDF